MDGSAWGWSGQLLAGVAVTVELALAAYAIALALGLLAACASRSALAPLRWLAVLYAMLVRGVPSLVLIYLLFYGLVPALRGFALALVGGDAEAPAATGAFWTGAMTLGLIAGGFCTEVIRGAWAAVPRGQEEAALAFGMSPALRLRRVVLPQLLRLALPGLGNSWQVVLKETALIYVVGVAEIMERATAAGRSTHQPFTFYLAAALLYLAITVLTDRLFHAAEARIGRPYAARTS